MYRLLIQSIEQYRTLVFIHEKKSAGRKYFSCVNQKHAYLTNPLCSIIHLVLILRQEIYLYSFFSGGIGASGPAALLRETLSETTSPDLLDGDCW
jgi:hypothetical protein